VDIAALAAVVKTAIELFNLRKVRRNLDTEIEKKANDLERESKRMHLPDRGELERFGGIRLQEIRAAIEEAHRRAGVRKGGGPSRVAEEPRAYHSACKVSPREDNQFRLSTEEEKIETFLQYVLNEIKYEQSARGTTSEVAEP
jgi:hypothetical protein